MSERLIGIVAALPEEIRPLQQRLQESRRVRLGRSKALQGVLAERRIMTMVTGDGSERARLGLTDLLTHVDLEAVFAIGIAGGLSADLDVGDVVVASRVLNGTGEVPPPDRQWLARARQLEGVVDGSVYSHSEIAIDPVAKERLWQQSGRRPAQVVDLESATYARAAAAKEIPYLAIRAVSDSSEEALPLDFNRFRRSDGSSDRVSVAWHAMRHPSIVPELMQLRERLQHCADRLARFVEEILSR